VAVDRTDAGMGPHMASMRASIIGSVGPCIQAQCSAGSDRSVAETKAIVANQLQRGGKGVGALW
jgi:hypothetical protein